MKKNREKLRKEFESTIKFLFLSNNTNYINWLESKLIETQTYNEETIRKILLNTKLTNSPSINTDDNSSEFLITYKIAEKDVNSILEQLSNKNLTTPDDITNTRFIAGIKEMFAIFENTAKYNRVVIHDVNLFIKRWKEEFLFNEISLWHKKEVTELIKQALYAYEELIDLDNNSFFDIVIKEENLETWLEENFII